MSLTNVTIPAGDTFAILRVSVTDDVVFEGDETFKVVLSGVGGASGGRLEAVGVLTMTMEFRV